MMQNLAHIYEQNSPLIKKFIISTLHRHQFEDASTTIYDKLHETFPSFELMYACDEDLIQTSANFGDGLEEPEHIGKNRSYLVEYRKSPYVTFCP